MNKYVVACWSDHTGELLQEVVYANSKVDAVKKYMQWEELELTTMDSLYSLAANCDSMVSVIEIFEGYKGTSPNLTDQGVSQHH